MKEDMAYLEILIECLKICKDYKPKLGHSRGKGYSFHEFQKIYGNDPFYSWIGLDNPLMYTAHKAAGGMTSIYRQIGIGAKNFLGPCFKTH